MVRLLVVASLGKALGHRTHNIPLESNLDGLHEYITESLGKPHAEAAHVANFIDTHWPSSDITDSDRRMVASQFFQVEERAKLLKQEAQANSTGECRPLAQVSCKNDVKWAFSSGKRESWAADAYYDLPHWTGKTITTATVDDFHKLYFCSTIGDGPKCDFPPCHCSNPPCDVCQSGDPVFNPDLGAPQQCHAHTYCVGKSGDCCPGPSGVNDPCCDFKPELGPIGPPIAEHRSNVPGEEVQRALHGGHYLGPLKRTSCISGKELRSVAGKMLHECPAVCDSMPECKAFTYEDNRCWFYSSCNPGLAADATMMFVKNVDKMTPQWLPSRTVSGSKHHFFVIGDWGSGSCPNKESMHYIFKGVKEGSEKWNTDHNAQDTIAKNMGELGSEVNPFLVVNAGDNFYWGGVFPRMLGGRGIHDQPSWIQGFENVYTHPSLDVPWVSILGNHDYGGDGCMSDVRSQFDYTIKDMLMKNRWKMPSAYYTHRIDFDDFSAEYFMLDTNIEDAYVGRHGGICKQTICWETMGRDNVPYDSCKKWFRQQWSEQKTWYEATLAASTADWKIVVMHHKPLGDVAKAVHPPVIEHGVQLMIGSHTHEMAFFDKWHTSGKPLLVVGAGGGAQANPGCGGAIYCSAPHQYGFADVEISKQQMHVRLFRHDQEVVMERNICKDGSVQEGDC